MAESNRRRSKKLSCVKWEGEIMKALVLIAALLVPGVAWAEGWVMICPRFFQVGEMLILDDNPATKWEQFVATDSALQCENAKVQIISRAQELFQGSKEQRDFHKERSRLCQCMPYDLWWKSQQPSR